MRQKTSFLAIGIMVVVFIGILSVIGLNRKSAQSPRKEITKDSQDDLKNDFNSIETLIVGYKSEESTLIGAVNDSGNNRTIASSLPKDVKFVTPLLNGRQLLYIGKTDDFDMGENISLKTIKPKPGVSEGETQVIYVAHDGYKIDSIKVSENNNWITWYEVKPPTPGSTFTHASDYYRSYKAKIEDVVEQRTKAVVPIQVRDEKKAAPQVIIDLPAVITNDGQVYFDGIIPATYALYEGLRNEKGDVILPVDTYNSKPYFFKQRYFLYSSFEPKNAKLPADGNTNSTRESIVNTNIVKVFDTQTKEITVVAPGNEGEHYKHPVYVDGSPDKTMRIVSEIRNIEVIKGKSLLVSKNIQLITKKEDKTFEKVNLFDTPTDKTYRILAVGDLVNKHKSVLIGEENTYRGNLGTGIGIGDSGYKNKLKSIKVIDLDSHQVLTTITPGITSDFEFISIMKKSTDEKIGIERDKKLATAIDKNIQQLQLQTFVPVEPKRVRKNPRSECEKEWQKKGYPNYEACEACPVYVYSAVAQNVKVTPLTPISESSSVPQIDNGSWNFKAGSTGNLAFQNGNYKNIDFLFPRGSVEMPSYGWVLAKDNYEKGVNAYAQLLGLNAREREDILAYILPQISDSEYVVLSNLNTFKARQLLDFKISPTPDSYSTIMFYVKKYNVKPSIVLSQPRFHSIQRGDYTVVSWGAVFE